MREDSFFRGDFLHGLLCNRRTRRLIRTDGRPSHTDRTCRAASTRQEENEALIFSVLVPFPSIARSGFVLFGRPIHRSFFGVRP